MFIFRINTFECLRYHADRQTHTHINLLAEKTNLNLHFCMHAKEYIDKLYLPLETLTTYYFYKQLLSSIVIY